MEEQITPQEQPPAVLAATQESDGSGRYDFGEAQRLSASQLRKTQQVHDRFAKELATSLSALTRRSVKALGVACSQVETEEAAGKLAQCRLMIALDAHPMDARITLGMDTPLVFLLLEALLGGRADGGGDYQRELTEIELSVLQDLHAVLTRELERAWRTAARFTLQVVDQQTDQQAKPGVPSGDGLLAASVDLEVETNPGRITLLYPARIGREIQGADADTPDAVRRPEVLQLAIFERLKSSALGMEGRLLGATMRLREIADLRAGDVLCLDIPLDRPIDIAINGESRFAGKLVPAGRKKAIRIQEVVPAKPGQGWSR